MTPKRLVSVLFFACILLAQGPKGWTPGKGYGWVYGPLDEVGALNGITDPASVLKALAAVKTGRVYDLGVRIDSTSYGSSEIGSAFERAHHAPTAIMAWRTAPNIRKDWPPEEMKKGERQHATNTTAVFISDNTGTHIDGLAHMTRYPDYHWYNGYRSQDYVADYGVLKCDADSIPPIIARGVLIDVATWKGVDALPAYFRIGPAELQGTLAAQKVDVEPGNVVLVRTGTLRYWGETGDIRNEARRRAIAEHGSAGVTLDGAKWLVEQKGAILLASDTSGFEVGNPPRGFPVVINPIHLYLLVDQGVHLGEFHNLEELSRDKVYRFTYIALTNRLKGTTASSAMRPIAIE